MTENAANPYDFPVISVGGPNDSLAEAAPNSTTTWEEDLYLAAGDAGFDRDETSGKVGTVTIVHWKGDNAARIPYTAYFVFGDEDDPDPEIVTLSGIVPGNGSWRGRGRGAFNGGTGKFENRRGSIPVESENPKRWG